MDKKVWVDFATFRKEITALELKTMCITSLTNSNLGQLFWRGKEILKNLKIKRNQGFSLNSLVGYMFGGCGVAHLMAQPVLRKFHYGPLAQTRLKDLMLRQNSGLNM